MLEKIVASFAILGSLGGASMWIHTHAEETIEEAIKPPKDIAQMNQAELQLYKVETDIKFIMIKPEPERNDFEKHQLKFLSSKQQYWDNRVRELESKD